MYERMNERASERRKERSLHHTRDKERERDGANANESEFVRGEMGKGLLLWLAECYR